MILSSLSAGRRAFLSFLGLGLFSHPKPKNATLTLLLPSGQTFQLNPPKFKLGDRVSHFWTFEDDIEDDIEVYQEGFVIGFFPDPADHYQWCYYLCWFFSTLGETELGPDIWDYCSESELTLLSDRKVIANSDRK